jgi:FAD/FMN-containing dehydrogenase
MSSATDGGIKQTWFCKEEEIMSEELTTALENGLRGRVVRRGDADFDEVRQLYNGMIDKRPMMIARCTDVADVVAAVNFGREKGLLIAVRGGGHNGPGLGSCNDGLLIDLSLMKGVHVDPATRMVRVEPGCTQGDVEHATHAFGLAVPAGIVSTTGIAGLTLGGGTGYLTRKHGLTIDNLLEADVVRADGSFVTASRTQHPDLFWALRGGGGNFGVVTSFEYRAHKLAHVLGGPVLHPLATAPQLFSFYREYAANLPDELSTQAVFVHAPDGSGTKLCGIAVCHAGDDAGRAEADVRPLRRFGSPAADMIQRLPYPVVNTGVDWLSPAGVLSYWKSAFFSELSDAAVEVLTNAFAHAPSTLCALVIEDFHGAVTRVPTTATAYPHREPGFNLFVIAQWIDPAQTETGIAWARETFDALAPYMADRSYTNYLSADDYDRVRHAYGANYGRLVELKRRYDPDNVFRLNLNIDPKA